MNTALLALSIAVTNGVCRVHCDAPSAGSYSVQVSNDLHNWRVIQAGHVQQACHVSASVPVGQCGFFRVEWW